jgi:GNAT superfamily N-acetyltransferase
MTFRGPELLDGEHELALFDCGVAALNIYLQRYALQNNLAGAARTYVATLEDGKTVVGYYSLAAGAVERGAAPERVAKGLARHPVPVVLLARLAVHRDYQNQRLGQGLLKDALVRSLAGAQAIGIRAVLVHAKDEAAARFYAKFGFQPSPTDPNHLFLLIKDIKKSLG